MLLSDRQEFDRQVSLLCAAYNVPIAERAEAYWTAFNRLDLSQWIRIVTHVIGPDGPEKMPTVAQLWAIRKKLSKAGQAPGVRGTQDVLTKIVETALKRFHLSETQVRQTWNWIGRNVEGADAEIVGVIIPQDPTEPVKFPSHRLMVADLPQEAAHG